MRFGTFLAEYELFGGGLNQDVRDGRIDPERGMYQDSMDGRIDQGQFQSSSGNSDSIGELTQQELTLIREHIT